MDSPKNRVEWERLLTGQQVGRKEELPSALRELLVTLDEKLGVADRHAKEKAPPHAEEPQHEAPPMVPPAGPHARRALINPDLTPGTGILPDPESNDPNRQPTS